MLAQIAANSSALLAPDNQAAAIDALSRIVDAPVDLSGDSGQTVVQALSAVAQATNASVVLQQVGSVLDRLAINQANSLVAAMPTGANVSVVSVTNSATIQMMVAVDPPGSLRLISEALTVPGSSSSFDPMPPDLLPSSVSIVTNFFALSFDPYAGANNGSALNTTGVTRLSFAFTDGTPINVSNVSRPIRFSLPAVDTSGDSQAICTFWNVEKSAYDTQGCVGVPSPYPPGHNVSFLDNFTAHSDAELVMAWNISGPMVDDGSCFVAVLDCAADNPGPYFVDPRTRELVLSQYPAVLYPDPYHPLDVPAVSCSPPGAANAPPPRTLRVYYGTDCALWRPDNAFNCSWNNTKQAFEGAGCAGGGPTRCMCRHVRARRRARGCIELFICAR